LPATGYNAWTESCAGYITPCHIFHCSNTYKHTNRHTHTHTRKHTRTHTRKHTRTHIDTRAHTHTHTHTHIHKLCLRIQRRSSTHTCTCANTCMHLHAQCCRVTYSILNALAGHFNSFGPTAPLPKKRLERINKASAAPYHLLSKHLFRKSIITIRYLHSNQKCPSQITPFYSP
jgi:hypothetical protein